MRRPELDLLRTFAILGMIIYHTAFDLAVFYGWDIDVLHGGWRLFARGVATLFLLLVGISFVISWNRNPSYIKQIRRAGIVLGCAMLITLVTYIAVGDQYVRFGILHLIGTSALILPLFVRLGSWNLFLGIALIIAGQWVPPPSFSSVDYFPPLPWLGVILIGMGMGNWVYIHHAYNIRHTPYNILTLPGRYSLWIYMMHQPIIIGIVWIILGPWIRG